jgi:hypothetical protein
MAFHNPSAEYLEASGVKSLPSLGGMLPVENEHDE